MRTTRKDLESGIATINRMAGTTPHNEFELDCAYGAYRIMRKTGPGMEDISPRLSAGQLSMWINAFIHGMDLARKDEYQAQQDYARNYGE